MHLMLDLVAIALASVCLALVLAFGARLRTLSRRIDALERPGRALERPSERGRLETENPLQGLRISLDIEQDHPYPVLATLLKDALLREGARIEAASGLDPVSGLVLRGEIVCNGYADVYFRAELNLLSGGELLFVLAEKPPHGDRQENLAREFVARLKTEWIQRERHGALRELGGA